AGADFVINTIQVGGIAATKVDLETPKKYGLLQTIGDTTGVGGVFRALRTFPVLAGLARDMQAVCPDAWLLNYTNPMVMNVWWLSRVAPQLKAVGLCHSVYWTVHNLCKLLGVPQDRVQYRSAGVNHQAWLTEWSLDGEDLYPRLRQKIADDPELTRRTRVEIFKRIGYYPTESSEHSSEYLSWFLRSPQQIERFRLTPLEYIQTSEANVAEFEDAKEALKTNRELTLNQEATEYAPQIIHSITTGKASRIHANVINHGLIDNLPEGATVEVISTVDRAGITPEPFGALPVQAAALNRTYLSVAELTVEAALTGDARMVRQAVLVDPNASSSLLPEDIWRLCDELTEKHRAYLPKSLGGDLEFTL
ncbi:MAG TPA: alpha-glucosidase/alpha-galactosidase, partial [Microbacteriaceae bacterium]|nr:alpha-glucosidase/alpha-galactosidase [Microbacteriaceae bacterium]